MARTVLLGIVLAVAAVGPAHAGGDVKGHCVLEFGGDTFINGPCDIRLLPDGGFVMRSANGYSAVVHKTSRKEGRASWSGVKGGKPTRSALGAVFSFQGCWTNEVAVICARR